MPGDPQKPRRRKAARDRTPIFWRLFRCNTCRLSKSSCLKHCEITAQAGSDAIKELMSCAPELPGNPPDLATHKSMRTAHRAQWRVSSVHQGAFGFSDSESNPACCLGKIGRAHV